MLLLLNSNSPFPAPGPPSTKITRNPFEVFRTAKPPKSMDSNGPAINRKSLPLATEAPRGNVDDENGDLSEEPPRTFDSMQFACLHPCRRVPKGVDNQEFPEANA